MIRIERQLTPEEEATCLRYLRGYNPGAGADEVIAWLKRQLDTLIKYAERHTR